MPRRVTYLANPTQGQYYGNIEQTDDGGHGDYNGLLLSVEHRFASHFTVLTNYTWSTASATYDFGGELAEQGLPEPEQPQARRTRQLQLRPPPHLQYVAGGDQPGIGQRLRQETHGELAGFADRQPVSAGQRR